MKPRIVLLGGVWWCYSGTTPIARGETPQAAYARWRALLQVSESGRVAR